jgi:hypothetical protein
MQCSAVLCCLIHLAFTGVVWRLESSSWAAELLLRWGKGTVRGEGAGPGKEDWSGLEGAEKDTK